VPKLLLRGRDPLRYVTVRCRLRAQITKLDGLSAGPDPAGSPPRRALCDIRTYQLQDVRRPLADRLRQVERFLQRLPDRLVHQPVHIILHIDGLSLF
jgi:hypothetical protein